MASSIRLQSVCFTLLQLSLWSLANTLSLDLVASTGLAFPSPQLPGCGDVDIISRTSDLGLMYPKLTWQLPPSLPAACGEQGFNASAIDAGLRGDAADTINAGYNLRGAFDRAFSSTC